MVIVVDAWLDLLGAPGGTVPVDMGYGGGWGGGEVDVCGELVVGSATEMTRASLAGDMDDSLLLKSLLV